MSLTDEPAANKNHDEMKVDRRRRPERRVEILKAVMTLLEKGNRRVTTAELAAEVGLSEAALYRHFTGMSAIFQALTEYLREHLMMPLEQSSALDSDSSLRRLRMVMEQQLKFFADNPGLCRIFLVEGVMTRVESLAMSEMVRAYGQQIRQIVVRAQEQGELPAGVDPESAAQFYVGLMQAATLRFVISGFTVSPITDMAMTWSYFCRGVGADEQRAAA
ncbi:MAG: nucleoid occlusion factor SlmA [Magnetococcales bacterium]|nr:nucleoid occlusion factor SlmA [Magnetococcales bacterium]NGZ05542.1 nucleoid occlusion factor SlmA [Magnetococcales bacterium]